MSKEIFSDDHLFSLKEARGMLRVSERSMFRYIHAGKLRATKIGYWRISWLDLKRFLAENANIREKVLSKDTFMYLTVRIGKNKSSNNKK